MAIASLMKLEGAEESIKVIEENVKALREKAKQAEILEANVAKTLAENNVEGSDLKTQLETLSAKNKNALTELEQYKTELEQLKTQNSVMQKRINIDKIASKYSANADVIEKLLSDQEINWINDEALIAGKAFNEYIEQNLAAFKPAIFIKKEEAQTEMAKEEIKPEPPKLGNGSAKGQPEGDKIANYIKSLYKMPETILRR